VGTFPTIFAFQASVHDRINRNIPKDTFDCGIGCQKLLSGVQTLADTRWGQGDKSNARLYLHYMNVPDGYTEATHQQILKESGLSGTKKTASLDDFIQAAENRAFDWIARKILDSEGRLSNLETGQVLYVLGTLLHAHQDRKHFCGNITDGRKDGLTSSAHFSWDIHQVFSDAWPSEATEKEALQRSIDFMKRIKTKLRAIGGDWTDEAFQRLGSFKMEPGKMAHDYKPPKEVMNQLFPEYPTRDLELQAHWNLRLGYFWGRDRGGFTGEIGGQWFLPRLGPIRIQPGLGVLFTHDGGGRSEIGLKASLVASEQVDFIGLGVAGTVGTTFDKQRFYGLEGVLKLFEGNLLFQVGHFWYPQSENETRFGLSLDAFAVARSFEWISRDF